MKEYKHIRKVTRGRFANWIEKQTAVLSSKKFETDKGHFTLQRASARNDLSRVSIKAIWSNDSTGQVMLWGDAIVFDLVPLDDERTEITSRCENESSTIPNYFDELLAEIDKRWKAEDAQAAPTEPATMRKQATDAAPTQDAATPAKGESAQAQVSDATTKKGYTPKRDTTLSAWGELGREMANHRGAKRTTKLWARRFGISESNVKRVRSWYRKSRGK